MRTYEKIEVSRSEWNQLHSDLYHATANLEISEYRVKELEDALEEVQRILSKIQDK